MIGAAIVPGVSARLAFIASAILDSLAAASIWRKPHPFQMAGMTLAILTSRLLPPVVLVLPIYLMAQRSGMLDTRAALVFIYTATNLPVAVWLLQPVFGSTRTDLEEAAEIDGASHLRILRDIVLPAAAPGLLAAGALVFLLCWNEYLFSVYLAPDRAMTLPPYLVAQMSVREQQAGSDAEEWARLAAAIVATIATSIVFVGFAQRHLAQRMAPAFRLGTR